MHAIEKILAKNSGREQVSTGKSLQLRLILRRSTICIYRQSILSMKWAVRRYGTASARRSYSTITHRHQTSRVLQTMAK